MTFFIHKSFCLIFYLSCRWDSRNFSLKPKIRTDSIFLFKSFKSQGLFKTTLRFEFVFSFNPFRSLFWKSRSILTSCNAIQNKGSSLTRTAEMFSCYRKILDSVKCEDILEHSSHYQDLLHQQKIELKKIPGLIR